MEFACLLIVSLFGVASLALLELCDRLAVPAATGPRAFTAHESA